MPLLLVLAGLVRIVYAEVGRDGTLQVGVAQLDDERLAVIAIGDAVGKIRGTALVAGMDSEIVLATFRCISERCRGIHEQCVLPCQRVEAAALIVERLMAYGDADAHIPSLVVDGEWAVGSHLVFPFAREGDADRIIHYIRPAVV